MRVITKTLWTLVGVSLLAGAPLTTSAQIADPGIPDTVYVDSATAYTGGSGLVPVNILNDEQLAGVEITLTYDSPDVNIDSFSFAGGRFEGFSARGWSTQNNSVTIYCIAYSDLIPPGNGFIGNLHISYMSTIEPQLVLVDTLTIYENQVEYSTVFSDSYAQPFRPGFRPGYLYIEAGGCCIGDRGNIDASSDDVVDISDLVYMVEFMFNGGPAPECTEEANLDADAEGNVDISDLVYLSDYMFLEGPPPPPCY